MKYGRYEVVDEIGQGSMGVVYRARDTVLEREVAIKVLPAEFLANEGRLARFEREARVLAALDHPNICTIHGIEETDDGRLFIAMAYYKGETLRKKIADHALGVDDAVKLKPPQHRGAIDERPRLGATQPCAVRREHVVGVADTATDYRVALARHHGYDLYGSTEAAVAEMRSAGLDPVGGLRDLLAAAGVPETCGDDHRRAAYRIRSALHRGGASHGRCKG